jgi:hypothetical protein
MPQPKHIHRRLLLVAFMSLLIVLGGIYFMYRSQLSKPLRISSTSPSSTVTKSPTSLSSLVTRLNSTLLSKDSNLAQNANGDSTNTIGFYVAGYRYTVVEPFSAQDALSYRDSDASDEATTYSLYQKNLPTINLLLTQAGFSKPIPSPAQQGLETSLLYTRNDSQCQVILYTLLDVTCVATSLLSNQALQAQPLVAAYTAATGLTPMAIAPPTLSPSMTPNFSLAVMDSYGSNGETTLHLYKEGSNAWQLVNLSWYNDPSENGTIEPNCQDFDSLIATAQAFKGLGCFNSATRAESVID